jgi:DNA ligase-1
VSSAADAITSHDTAVIDGYEGLILRASNAAYKHGRSTLKEAGMIKLKMFEDSEAVVLSAVPLKHNHNLSTASVPGLKKRSSHKANKVASTTLMGALEVQDLKSGVKFEIGTGFTADERFRAWPAGTVVKYKYFAHGVKDKPRHPVFLGIRSKLDL